MKAGDIALIQTGPPGQEMHVAGRLLEYVDRLSWWVDVNMLGQHLPQMYREHELQPMADPAHHGLCEPCQGLGSTASTPIYSWQEVVFADHPPCGACAGSGRPAVTVTVERSASVTQGTVSIDTAANDSVACDICRRAGQPMDTPR